MSDKNDAYVEQGLDRLLDQFNGSDKLRALIASYLNQVQELEDAAHPLFAERSVDNATGDRLDGIGAILKLPRGGRTDTDYRFALLTEILVLQSNGTEEDILTILHRMVQMPTPDYEFVEYFPKTVFVRAVDYPITSFEFNQATIATALRRALSAATELLFVGSIRNDSITYTLSSQAATLETSSSLGLANDAQTTGGHLAWAF